METHEVCKPFEGGGGRKYTTGERVDASAWKHTAQLVEMRHLRPLPEKDLFIHSAEVATDRAASLEQQVLDLKAVCEQQAAQIAELQSGVRRGPGRPRKGEV